jgi:rfaE bifunctional protein nucleotidyltransferase chain/domain/rfaE bifunctional protein kinase chain/domain
MSTRPTGRLVVVGDALLDVDLVGSAGRLAPDAPVPVLDGLIEHPRPGGAALAAALAAEGGRDVVLVTPLADDADGDHLGRLLHASGVRVVAVPTTGSTPVKRRVRADGQSLLRLDSGRDGGLGAVPDAVAHELGRADAVLVSDYGRGTTRDPAVRALLAAAARRVPVVWDPHPRGGAPVPGVRLVTPNAAEARAASPAAPGCPATSELAELTTCATTLVREWDAHAVAVTRGRHGALLTHGESSPSVFPAPPTTARDSCGAGDRFAAAAATALADGALVAAAVQSAVRLAAAFVGAGGAASWTPCPRPEAATRRAGPTGPTEAGSVDDLVADVRARGGTVVATGGCFDLLHAGHVATLEAARGLGDCLVVCLNSDASVARLKGPARPLVPQADRARVLEALAPVDAVVVFGEDTPEMVLRRLRPDVWVKGGDYAGAELPEAPLLRSWGGQSVVLPYLTGRSTTALVATASAGAPVDAEPARTP